MSDAAVEIEYLKKSYGRFQALAGVSLSVPRGSVFGLLGPNGAGKSTLVKSLLTIIRPTECRGTLLGKPIGDRKTLSRVGYLPEQAKFQDYLTGREIITYSGRLTNMPSAQIKSRIVDLLALVKMQDWADKPVGTYSKGMRQRIGLAQALVNSPEVVFLDEPTDGVDPEGRIDIREIIERMKADGRTVFVNSHLLSEVEQVADHVAILAGGKVIRSGTVAELTRSQGHYQISTLEPVPLGLREKFQQNGIEVAGNKLTMKAEDVTSIQPVIDALRVAQLSIREIREERFTLEEAFLQAIRAGRKEDA
jgi:ABC-2 type transport system ATP-binding protein